MLKALQPTPVFFKTALAVFDQLWQYRLGSQKHRAEGLKADPKQIDESIAQLLDRIVDTTSPALVDAYEKRIKEMEHRKAVRAKKSRNLRKTKHPFDRSFRTAMAFLKNPYKLWAYGRIEEKRTVLKLVFSERVVYRRESGFRTGKTTLPFNMVRAF